MEWFLVFVTVSMYMMGVFITFEVMIALYQAITIMSQILAH